MLVFFSMVNVGCNVRVKNLYANLLKDRNIAFALIASRHINIYIHFNPNQASTNVVLPLCNDQPAQPYLVGITKSFLAILLFFKQEKSEFHC